MRGRGLRRGGGVLDSNCLGRVSRMGDAELESAARDCAFAGWFSDRASPRRAYDITAKGIQLTPETPEAHRRRNLTLLIAAGVFVSAAAGFFLLPRVVCGRSTNQSPSFPSKTKQRSG